MKALWPARPDGTNNSSIKKSPGLAYDCELAARIQEGDRDALRHLIERHIGRVQMYLVHRLGEGRDEIIDKIVTATFGEALRLIGPYANGSAATPMEFWLIRLAEKNLKRLGADKSTTGQLTTGTDPADHSDLARFRAALAAIPERFRAVLVLAVIEQLPAADIAHSLGTSPAGAMRRLHAALKSVSIALRNSEGGIRNAE